MSSADASECLNMESADFAHQAKEGLWNQNRVSKVFILTDLKEKKLPWAVSSTSAPPAAHCDSVFIAAVPLIMMTPQPP